MRLILNKNDIYLLTFSFSNIIITLKIQFQVIQVTWINIVNIILFSFFLYIVLLILMEMNRKAGALDKTEKPIQYKIMLPYNPKREFWSLPNKF